MITSGFIDGFDWCDNTGVLAKYTMFTGNFTPQAEIVDGRQNTGTGAGKAYRPFNTAFTAAMWTRIIGAHDWAAVSFNIKPGGASIPAGVILRFDGSPPYLETDVNDTKLPSTAASLTVHVDSAGIMRFYVGGPGGGRGIASNLGLLRATASTALVLNQWTFVELRVLWGVHGAIECRYDDAVVVGENNVDLTLVGGPNVPPDRVSRYLSSTSGAMVWDDYSLRWGTGAADDPQGPSRVSAAFVVTGNSFFNPHGALNDAAVLQQNPFPQPEGSGSIWTDANGPTDYFQVGVVKCYGLVLGVAFNCMGRRKVAGARASINLFCKPQPGPATTLLISEVNDSYTNLQGWAGDFSILNPAQRWTDGAIHNAAWGIQAGGPNVARLTQAYVEKITSLRSQPFGCGQIANWSF